MNFSRLTCLISLLFLYVLTAFSQTQKLQSHDKTSFLIEGSAFPDSVKESSYDRVPAAYKPLLRPYMWSLSKSSAGLSVRFVTNSTRIGVKWTLISDARMDHMADTGIKGLDLYCKVGKSWEFVNTARLSGVNNDFLLVDNMSKTSREYRMFLPLYDGVTNVEVLTDSLSSFEKPAPLTSKPIVFYGTSITQGGCASRPGMAYTNIISRKLDVNCVNLGFNGNGKMEKPIAELMSGIDASFYVIDCVPNMSVADIRTNTKPLIDVIRAKQLHTPIVLVEGLMYEKSFLDDSTKALINNKNTALKSEYTKLIKAKYSNIYYIDNVNALGSDHEGTVDGVHLTDLGFLRFSDFLIAKFRSLHLKIK
jgi:hypothetical protein